MPLLFNTIFYRIMLRSVLIFVLVLFTTNIFFAQAPAWQWGKDANSSNPEGAWDVAYDTFSGNAYVGGSFQGNLSAVYGSSFTSSYGNLDGFLAKYDPSGNVLWAIKLGGTNVDEVRGVATDGTGNVYVTGYFSGTADFDPSAATFNLISSGGQDGFLAKYSSTGTFIWAAKFSGSGDEDSWKMSADANGIYVTGSYQTPAVTFGSYSSVITKSTTVTDSQYNMYGAKYNSNGTVQWVISGGGDKDDIGYNVIADANSIYFIGSYNDDITFNNSSGIAGSILPAQQNNKTQVYILAVTQLGVLSWQTNITSNTGGDMVAGTGITQDATNLYVTGYFDGNINFKYPSPTLTQNLSGGGSLDLYLAKLSKTGTFIWNTAATGNGNGEQIGRTLEVDGSGNIILGGCYTNGLNYTAAGGPNFTASGAHDIFITSYSPTGSFLWSTRAGGNTRDYLNGMAVDDAGAVFVCGESDGQMVIGTTTLTSGGGKNVFVGKLGCSVITNNTITASQTICIGSAPSTFTGSIPVGGTLYSWESSLDALTWTTTSGTYTNQNYTAPSLTATTYYRRIVSSTGSCSASSLISNTITINADAVPSVANAGSNQTVCASTATLNGNIPAIGSGIWSVITGTSSVTTSSNPSSPVTAINTGTNSFLWTISNGICPASSSTVTIIRSVLPSSNAGANQTICTVTATMAATTPTTGAGSWSLLSGTGSIITPTNSSSQITGLGTGTNNFVWTVSNGVCTAATSTATIFRDIQPTANAGANQTICAVNATMAATIPTTGAGSWSLLSGTGSIITPTNSSSQITGLGTGTNNFVWTVSNGVCTAATSTVVVVRDIQPIANAGANQTICAVTATMAATTPTTGTGSWSLLSGTGIIATSNSSTSQITGLGTGTNNFMWTVSNGVCTAAISTVTLIRNAGLTAFAGSNQSVCTSSATLNASIPPIGNGSWSVLTGASSVSINTDPASQITSLSFGLNTYLWSVSNSSCPTATSVVNIWRDTSPFADAGTSQNICSSTATLTAISPTLGTGLWSILGGTAAFAFFNNPLATLSSVATGTNTFMWTVTNGACISTSTVSVIRDTPQSAIAGTNQTICTSTATLGASGPVSGNGTWSFISGTATVSSFTNPASQVTSINTGTTTFLWTVNNGACPSTTATVDIMRDIQPSSFAGADQTVCATSAAFAATSPSVGSGIWSPLSGGATIVAPGNPLSPVTGIATGTNSFLWTVSNGVCPTATSIVNIFKEIPPGNANAGPDFTVCSSSCTLSASSATPGNAGWSVYLGTSAINSTNNPGSNVSNLSIGLNQFIWKNINGSCPPSLDTVSVFFTTPLLSASAGQDQELCSTVCTLAANNPGYGIWSVLAGGSVISNISGATTSVTSLGAGNNIFIWSVTKSFCPTTEDTVVIHRDENPSLSNAGPDQRVCGADANLSAISATIGKGQWKILEGASQIGDATLFQTPITGLSTGSNKFVWIVTNGVCLAASDTLLILSDALPSEALAGADLLVCQDEINLDANVPTVGKGTWSLLSGTCSIMQPSNNITAISGLKEGVQLLEWTVVNGVCPEKSDTVQITRTFTPINPDAGDNQVLESSTTRLSATIPQAGVGTWTILSGSCEFSDIHDKDASVSKLSFGNTLIRWTIVNKSCPDVSDDILIHVKDLNIPNAFSPNGDGINDRFVITSLNYYKEVKISIFNRWGNLLYHNAEYHNDWAGNSLNNERLADDTYYYIIEIPELKNFTGFIMIKRDL